MDSSDNILNELKEISPLLADIEKKNVFSVPEKYFINLHKQISKKINGEFDLKLATSENHTLKVPERYFENLAGNILDKIKNLESDDAVNELKQISPALYSLKNKNVFKVPDGYFENLAGNVLDKIKSLESDDSVNELKQISPTLYSLKSKNVFKVSNGYFENLAGNVLDKIKSLESDNAVNELKQISPTLYSLKSKNVFEVPDGYFENLANQLLSKVKYRPLAKIVSMKKRSYFWNYAAAAIITGILAISSLWISDKSLQQPAVKQTKATAFIPASYLKESFKYKNEQQIEEGISKLSDDDIIKYLELTDNDADNKELATSTGEKDLPSQEDYLLDEKTLDKYLDQIDLIKPSAN